TKTCWRSSTPDPGRRTTSSISSSSWRRPTKATPAPSHVTATESAGASPIVPPSTLRRELALLSALAEAPDLGAAATFLLNDLLAATGAARACLLRFDTNDEHLSLTSFVGFETPPPTEYSRRSARISSRSTTAASAARPAASW